MVGLGAGALGLVVIAASFPGFDDNARTRVAANRMVGIADRASAAFLRDRALPSDLASLASAGVLDANGHWQYDPFGAGRTLDYAITGLPARLQLRSRGRDRTLGSGDDPAYSIDIETPARALTRDRLRVLRAVFLRSDYMDSPAMTATDRAAMRGHVRDWSLAQRSIRYATAANRIGLIAQRDAAAARIESLRLSRGLIAVVPPNATGPGGLLEQLGLPDSLGIDGFGATFATGVVGFVSAGGDTIGGNDDDL
jgi:hypothetical protein